MAYQTDAPLFAALVRAAKQRMGKPKAYSLANTAWAFAKTYHTNVPLVAALARAAKQCMY